MKNIFPLISPGSIPWIETEQMIEVDRAMEEDFNILLIQMMENAGRCLAIVARSLLDDKPTGRHVSVLAGTGGNGGGALVAARRLWGWGANVSVLTTRSEDRFGEVPARQLGILKRMEVPVFESGSLEDGPAPDLVVDGLIGYSLNGAPRGRAAELIRSANESKAPTLSLDVPSGLDASSGSVFDPSIRACATVTLALPKEGLRHPEAREKVGDLYLADISVPPEVYRSAPLDLRFTSPFDVSDVVRIDISS